MRCAACGSVDHKADSCPEATSDPNEEFSTRAVARTTSGGGDASRLLAAEGDLLAVALWSRLLGLLAFVLGLGHTLLMLGVLDPLVASTTGAEPLVRTPADQLDVLAAQCAVVLLYATSSYAAGWALTGFSTGARIAAVVQASLVALLCLVEAALTGWSPPVLFLLGWNGAVLALLASRSTGIVCTPEYATLVRGASTLAPVPWRSAFFWGPLLPVLAGLGYVAMKTSMFARGLHG